MSVVDGIKQRPQHQGSLTDQLEELHLAAARLGLYDAADYLWKVADLGPRLTQRTEADRVSSQPDKEES